MNPPADLTLPRPARYFPLSKGVYEVVAGLKALGSDFGNQDADSRIFQLDRDFHLYRDNKLQCRNERLSKYLTTSDYSPVVETHVARFLANCFTEEYPNLFSFNQAVENRGSELRCRLTGEVLRFDAGMRLVEVESSAPLPSHAVPPYVSAFDALCSQIQEDTAVLSVAGDGRDYLSALHLCSPSHWAAEDKIGKNFAEIHAPVPGIEGITKASAAFVEAMINKGPFVRFVWGVASDRRLNRHPQPPDGVSPAAWRDSCFQARANTAPFTLRIERQVLQPLPEVRACLFVIHVYFIDAAEVRANPRERACLRSALLSMSAESGAYKGVANCLTEIIQWLDG